MPVTVQVRGDQLDNAVDAVDVAVTRIFADLRRVDSLFSIHRHDSAVSRYNRGELSRDQVGSMVKAVVRVCEQATQRTDGFFDAFVDSSGRWPRFDPSAMVNGWAAERA